MKSDPPNRSIAFHPRSASPLQYTPTLHRRPTDDPAWIEERRRQRREKWNAFWRDAGKIAEDIYEGLWAIGKVVLVAYVALVLLTDIFDHRDRDG
ncbi:MAG: hypothetical protein HY360_11145 [Verrucomicrobia bacterium]|nr:hypothetical protein [Verrucomicrobiota bacterium]